MAEHNTGEHLTPPTVYSSAHTTHDSSYSPLYPVYPEQERGIPVSHTGSTYTNSAIGSPGLESVTTVQGHDDGKEVVHDSTPAYSYKQVVPPQPEYYAAEKRDHAGEAEAQQVAPTESHKKQKRRIFGCIPLWICIGLVVVLIIALALGVGLGVGLSKKSSSTTSSGVTSQPDSNPRSLSTTGAFNGSGFATATASGASGELDLYFQHYTGQLRRLQLSGTTWSGGDINTIVATDAKNATPISVVAYAQGTVSTWHLFYIDKANTVRQKISQDSGSTWQDGPLASLNLKALNSSSVALQACYGNFYTSGSTTSSVGIHLFYAQDAQTIQQVDWTVNATSWTKEDTYTANGHAGIGCYSWGPGTVWYAMMVNLDNAINVVYKDAKSTTPQAWTNTSVIIPGAMPNTSLGYTDYFFAQLNDGSLAGYNITFDSGNTKLVGGDYQFKLSQKPIAGSHFSVTGGVSSDGSELAVFSQENGTDILENLKDASGKWSYTELPVPST
ncbi:hypothetical protein BT63DRAFT_324861 [Microthyrium microscopicum]|uniref:Uncharacterized protein n=1 Tax=Microthyrium microscopicum TaxID=703497 RepID=A0A6A6U6M5_9PEZI|nr:hypothetical protein BT63DRAFT_324861 [Microthyrium microscopicum]